MRWRSSRLKPVSSRQQSKLEMFVDVDFKCSRIIYCIFAWKFTWSEIEVYSLNVFEHLWCGRRQSYLPWCTNWFCTGCVGCVIPMCWDSVSTLLTFPFPKYDLKLWSHRKWDDRLGHSDSWFEPRGAPVVAPVSDQCGRLFTVYSRFPSRLGRRSQQCSQPVRAESAGGTETFFFNILPLPDFYGV